MKFKSTLLLLLTAMIWGFAFVAQATVSDSLGPFAFNGIRFTLGAASLIPVILIFERKRISGKLMKKTILVSMLAGAVLFVASGLQQIGIFVTGNPSKAAFITTLYNVLVPIIGFLFFKRKTGAVTWIGAFVSVAGLYLLSFMGTAPEPAQTSVEIVRALIAMGLEEHIQLIGDIILIIGSIFWALHIIIIDRFANEVPPLKFASFQFFTCGGLSLLVSLTETYTWQNVLDAGTAILYCGICSVGIAYTCQILGQRGAEPTLAAIICSSESVFSAIGSAVILHKFLSGLGYLGCVLIFVGMIMSQLDGTSMMQNFLAKLGAGARKDKSKSKEVLEHENSNT